MHTGYVLPSAKAMVVTAELFSECHDEVTYIAILDLGGTTGRFVVTFLRFDREETYLGNDVTYSYNSNELREACIHFRKQLEVRDVLETVGKQCKG